MGFCLPQIGLGSSSTDLKELRVLLRSRHSSAIVLILVIIYWLWIMMYFLVPLVIGIPNVSC